MSDNLVWWQRRNERLRQRDDNQETKLIGEEDTPENRLRKLEQDEMGSREEAAAPLVPELMTATLCGLSRLDRGCLIAFFTDVLQYPDLLVAQRFEPPGSPMLSTGDPQAVKLRVDKWWALKKFRCGEKGRCDRRPGCAHARGKVVWEMVIREVVSSLSGEIVS